MMATCSNWIAPWDALAALRDALAGPEPVYVQVEDWQVLAVDDEVRLPLSRQAMAERALPDMAALADGMAQIGALTPLIRDMSQEQVQEYAVAMIALTEAGQQHSDPPLRTELRAAGDGVRDMLREKGVTLSPWYS
jgi:hypothetical protein